MTPTSSRSGWISSCICIPFSVRIVKTPELDLYLEYAVKMGIPSSRIERNLYLHVSNTVKQLGEVGIRPADEGNFTHNTAVFGVQANIIVYKPHWKRTPEEKRQAETSKSEKKGGCIALYANNLTNELTGLDVGLTTTSWKDFLIGIYHEGNRTIPCGEGESLKTSLFRWNLNLMPVPDPSVCTQQVAEEVARYGAKACDTDWHVLSLPLPHHQLAQALLDKYSGLAREYMSLHDAWASDMVTPALASAQ
jgi:hypothetical protein